MRSASDTLKAHEINGGLPEKAWWKSTVHPVGLQGSVEAARWMIFGPSELEFHHGARRR